MSYNIRLFCTLTFLILATVIGMAPAGLAQTPQPATIANTMLISESGQAIRPADYRGKVVIVSFWGAWCGTCLQEMPSIRALQSQLADLGGNVAFLFVSAKSSQFQNDVAYLRQHGVAGTAYRWGGASAYVPTTFVLDPSGAVALYRNSPVDWQLHANEIRSLAGRGRLS